MNENVNELRSIVLAQVCQTTSFIPTCSTVVVFYRQGIASVGEQNHDI